MNSITVSKGRSTLLKYIALLLICVTASGTKLEPDPHEEARSTDEESIKRMHFRQSIEHSKHLARKERAQKMQTYWNEAFQDIRKLAVNFTLTPEASTNQWKEFLEDSQSMSEWPLNATDTEETERKNGRPIRTRFEGFASWERKLQQWGEDLADYLETTQVKEGDYPFSTYGRPAANGNRTITESLEGRNSTHTKDKDEKIAVPKVKVVLKHRKEGDIPPELPKPAPAKPGEAILPHTDLSDKSKRILIVTTAALPWMTGTAVNPLLRAAYMVKGRKKAGGSVTLMLPWVERRADQERVYGDEKRFDTPEDQEEYIRNWLSETANMDEASSQMKIQWYTAWQERAENSLYSMGDITALVPANEVDICILEEPEHLNWYRAPGENWTAKFKHVVGIVHTNYFAYAQEQPAALIRAPAMKLLAAWMCRAHCHRLIKLSGTLGQFAPEKELVENVHGVRGRFLEVGEELKQKLRAPGGKADPVFGSEADPKVYFIGKMLWSKGLGSLMELLKYAEESAALRLRVDMYGGGPDKDAAASKSVKLGLNMPYHGSIDHAELAMTHKIFINPSTSEVLCTTVAEALAMGKYVICPSHPSNDFFAQFPNCLPYATKEEFVGNLYYALTHSPEPLSKEYSYALTWKAATERLEAAGCIPVVEAERMANVQSSDDAGIDITLPPLIENENRRKKLANTFRRSRGLYRQFRIRLQQEIGQSKVLPYELQQRILSDLDKRLDLDIDAMLASPTLRLQLSPAELDKRLLAFYNSISQNPITGDILRVIGGGTNVGMQNLYMKQQAQKLHRKEGRKGLSYDAPSILPEFPDLEGSPESDPGVTPWVKLAIQRNLPSGRTSGAGEEKRRKGNLKMSLQQPTTIRSQNPLHHGNFNSRWSTGTPLPRLTRISVLI